MPSFAWILIALACISVTGQTELKKMTASIPVRFEGNTVYKTNVLSREYSKCPFKISSDETDERVISLVSRCADVAVKFTYGRDGYWDTKVSISLEKLLDTRTAVVKIVESERSYLGKVEWHQDTERLFTHDELLSGLGIKAGDPINFVKLCDFVQNIRARYYDNGYLAVDLDVDTNTNIDPATNRKTVSLEFTLREFEPFTIGKIEFYRPKCSGYLMHDERFTDDFLAETFGLKEGEIYSETRLQKGLRRLNKVGDFDLMNSRSQDLYYGGFSNSRDLSFVEDEEKRTVKIQLWISEPCYTGEY
jgi:outer membrane protein assembly factor BamA